MANRSKSTPDPKNDRHADSSGSRGFRLWKYSGAYLTATGIIHTAVALVMGCANYMPMLREGLWNSVGDSFERGFILWFLVCGILLLFLGPLLQHYLRVTQKPAPMWFGVALLIFSAVGCVIEPVSGFWLFVPQAVVIIVANRRS